MLAASVSVLLPKIKAMNNLKLLCLSTETKKFRFSVRIYKKKKTGWHQTQDHPCLCTTEPNRNRHECNLRDRGHYYPTNWRRTSKIRDKIFENRGVDDMECIFFSCIFSNVSRLLVYFILPKVLEVKESEIFSSNFFRHYFWNLC